MVVSREARYVAGAGRRCRGRRGAPAGVTRRAENEREEVESKDGDDSNRKATTLAPVS